MLGALGQVYFRALPGCGVVTVESLDHLTITIIERALVP